MVMCNRGEKYSTTPIEEALISTLTLTLPHNPNNNNKYKHGNAECRMWNENVKMALKPTQTGI
jgi:hypothetical protein